MTRRELLKWGGGTLAATLIPASALGRGGVRPPSDRVAMGFIGIGTQGEGHLLGGAWTSMAGGFTARRDVQVLAVCDVWRDRRERPCNEVNQYYADLFGVGSFQKCEAYADFRRVLDRQDIDAVLIASPAHWHGVMTVMAAQAGKDIYCEKPTAVTVRESQAVLASVRRYGIVYQAGTQQRSEFGGIFRRVCEFIRSGRIGRLKEVYAYRRGGAILWPKRFGPAQPVPADLDWDLYLGPAPAIPYDGNTGPHRFDFAELNWAQHHYDTVQWAADADQTGPVELFMEGDCPCYRYAEDVVVYGKPYPGEPIGMQGGGCFVGTDGRIAVERGAVASYPEEILRAPLRPDEVRLPRAECHSSNFLDCVRTRSRPMCGAAVAHRAASAMLLSGIVLQVRRPLVWDPLQEQFLGDREADRLLSIAYRPPWTVV
jgi:hypothetical protein